jgi:hypothetical protein
MEAIKKATTTEYANTVVDTLTGNLIELPQLNLGPDGVE